MAEWKVIVVLICPWLMACSPTDDAKDHFETYLTRVAYVLDVPAPELQAPQALGPTLVPLPAQRELTLPTPRISTGVLDALKLGQCDLLGLVAEHNAPAGKSQSAAGQFAYHLQFQQGLAQCLSQAEDAELSAWLTELGQLKAPLLPIYFWNLMVEEPEVRAALIPAVSGLPFQSSGGYQATLQAFSLLARLQAQAQQYSAMPLSLTEDSFIDLNEELNRALRGLYKNPYLGELFYSLAANAAYLEQSIEFLGHLQNINCQGPHAIKAERLRNAMQHYYIKDIQPYFTELDRQFVQLAPLLQATLAPPADKADLMADYNEQMALGLGSQLYVRYRALTLQHAKVWQNFLTRCELSPKRE